MRVELEKILQPYAKDRTQLVIYQVIEVMCNRLMKDFAEYYQQDGLTSYCKIVMALLSKATEQDIDNMLMNFHDMCEEKRLKKDTTKTS